MRRIAVSVLFLTITSLTVFAKDQPFQVVSWPDAGQPVLRFTFSKFKDLGSGIGKERTYTTEVVADNLSERTISSANFSLYVFDKSKARIGEGYINLTNVAAGETVKFQVTISASGSPSSISLATAAPRSVSITVNSSPQGAVLTVDGKAAGITPKIVDVAIGNHVLEFQKEGFNPGKFPLEITAHDTSGGSVTYELGSAAHDTIELRDGSVLEGDLVSVNGMRIEVRIGGNTQNFDRNQVKRILLTQRVPMSN
jgi:PEGA domain